MDSSVPLSFIYRHRYQQQVWHYKLTLIFYWTKNAFDHGIELIQVQNIVGLLSLRAVVESSRKTVAVLHYDEEIGTNRPNGKSVLGTRVPSS